LSRKVHDRKPLSGTAVADMLSFAQVFDMERYGAEGGPLHD
jgi:hypothetical protein